MRKGHASPREAFLAVSNYKSQFGHDPQEGPIERLMTAHLEKVLTVVRFTLAGISQWEGGVE
uniref:Uncharacterized protein n=1 Tax=Nonomuraea gerenzanensis TaxID=93944 RepID=A0A1M4DVH1_9ACTN|nr:hypothetical protein BN4615_P88 [Nonomuraea gerenzanensis]